MGPSESERRWHESGPAGADSVKFEVSDSYQQSWTENTVSVTGTKMSLFAY